MSKVLYFHHYNDFSGSTRVLANILEKEVLAGNRPVVITDNTINGCLSKIDNARIINLPILRINRRAIPGISQIVWIFEGLFFAIIYGRKFDTFYINTIVPAYAAICGSLMRKHIIYHVHEKFTHLTLQDKICEYVFSKTKADRIFVSNYLKEQYPNPHNYPSRVQYNKLSVEYNNNVKRVAAENHNLDTIIMVSSLFVEKGVLVYRNLAKQMSNYRFFLIVNAPMDSVLTFLGNDVPSNMKIYSNQKDVQPFYAVSDLVLNLTQPNLLVESFGMTILEGMAYGLPAIVPNAGGPMELVEDGYNGFTVDVTDLDLLEERIRYCLTKENYIRLYNNSLSRFESLDNA